ncbi:MAG TPA: DUF6541 family protein [Anaerolineales bacterium]|nr:DUF6541 family protein [Anaerolineales bacterium]
MARGEAQQNSRSLLKLVLLLSSLALLLSACTTLTDFDSTQDYRGQVVGVVSRESTVGQSLVVRRPDFNGIVLWLRPKDTEYPGDAALQVRILEAPGAEEALFEQSLSFSRLEAQFPVTIAFPPLSDRPEESYYLELSTPDGEVNVMGRLENASPRGEAYLSGEPMDADLSFRLLYRYDLKDAWEDLMARVGEIWLLAPLLLTVWLPGWLLLQISGLGTNLERGERWALAVGLSLAVIPLVPLWTSLLGLRWTGVTVWLAMGALVVAAGWWIYQHNFHPGRLPAQVEPDRLETSSGESEPVPDRANALPWIPMALVAILLVSFFLRMAMVRDLAAPPWVDSVHHGVITRLIMEDGQYPTDYEPYLEIGTAHYHPGFHALLALFTSLSGLEMERSMLIFGQALNALAILGVYLFTVTLTGQRLAGLIAALIAGFLTPMPAYFTTWGRYTQLASLTILPTAFTLLTRLVLDKPRQRTDLLPGGHTFRLLLLTGIACGGLFLTHYRVAAFLFLLVLAWMLVRSRTTVIETGRANKLGLEAGLLAGGGSAALLLSLPWWPGLISTLIGPSLAWGSTAAKFFDGFTWSFLTSAQGTPVLWLAGAGLLLGLLTRRNFPLVLVIWTGLLFFIANLAALKLPGGGLVNTISVEISLFLPLAAAAGYFVAWVLNAAGSLLPKNLAWLPRLALLIGSLGVVWLGFRDLLPVLNPVTVLYRSADEQAMDWMRDNLPAGSEVQINPFYWGYNLYAGADGGYWIGPLAGKSTNPPPVLYGIDPSPEADPLATTDLNRQVLDLAGQPDELYRLLSSQGIEYVYLGARGGGLSPTALLQNQHFKLLYAGNLTYVFEVGP